MCTILQILSVSLFEKIPLQQALSGSPANPLEGAGSNQLNYSTDVKSDPVSLDTHLAYNGEHEGGWPWRRNRSE